MSITWNRLRYGARALLGRNPAGRRLTVFPDDVFIVSYPRSGNTWVRFLIGNLFDPDDPITFANVESRVPEIYFFSDQQLLARSRPRILKSHEYFDPRYKRTIYIVRDPRDVAVSLYHYSIKRKTIPPGYALEEFIPRFIAGEFFEYCGSWEEHVLSWHATRKSHTGFLFLRYEDLLAHPEQELAAIANTLHAGVVSERVARAVELSSAARMRNLEEKHSSEWRLTRGTRQDVAFVRRAKSGAWQSELSPALVSTIERAWGTTMKNLGYDLLVDGDRELVKS
ncbi:MAG TPA: sulfotransferase domain-containing protein [Candidatus Binatia bacterium]|nr:sulfotransferase domain-containing protein [Candidatus Binatia bacterium]